MKRLALLTSVVLVGISTAIPVTKVRSEVESNEKDFHDEHLNLCHDTLIHRRSLTSMKLPGSLKLAALAKVPAQIKAPSKPSGRSDVATRHGQKYTAKSGNGKTYSVEDIQIYPPAEASGLIKGFGYYETTTHDRLMPESIQKHSSQGNPEGKTVKGPVSAYVRSVSLSKGGKSTAQGMHKALATVINTPYTKGCITCEQPGQAPIKVVVSPGTGKVVMEANNANPRLGPVKMTAETYGPGETSAAASNHPI